MRRFFKDTKYILLFVILLTAGTVASNLDSDAAKVVETKPHDILKHAVDSPNAISVVNFAQKRRPAAVDNQKEMLNLSNPLFCETTSSTTPKFNHGSSRVLVEFSICEKNQIYKELTLINETNGFKAQLFKLPNKTLKTDYVQLSEGVNKIRFEIVSKDGQKRIEWLEITSVK